MDRPRVILLDRSARIRGLPRLLSLAGFEVVVARTSTEALVSLKSGPCHAVVADVEKLTTGDRTLLHAARVDRPTCLRVALTEAELEFAVKLCGAESVFVRPIDYVGLLEALNTPRVTPWTTNLDVFA